MEEHLYKIAKKRVKKKKDFYGHLSAYIAVGLFFFMINMATFDGELWFFFPLFPWGIGLLIHYFSVFGLPWTGALTTEWEDKELAKEMESLRKATNNERSQSNYDRLDLDERPDLAPDDELELKEFKKLRREWDDSDFV